MLHDVAMDIVARGLVDRKCESWELDFQRWSKASSLDGERGGGLPQLEVEVVDTGPRKEGVESDPDGAAKERAGGCNCDSEGGGAWNLIVVFEKIRDDKAAKWTEGKRIDKDDMARLLTRGCYMARA